MSQPLEQLTPELRAGVVQCIRAARDSRWEFRGVAENGARIRIVNLGTTAQLRALLAEVEPI